MLTLKLHAARAAWRGADITMRGTYTVCPPSAAYGIICNIAGVEIQKEGKKELREDCPKIQLAVNRGTYDSSNYLLNHHHKYLIGSGDKELNKELDALGWKNHGQKRWIAAVKSEYLSDVTWVISIRGNPEFENKVIEGLAGNVIRYGGAIYAGDNNCEIDSIKVINCLDDYNWLTTYSEEIHGKKLRKECVRLPVIVNRIERCKTVQKDFVFAELGEQSWIQYG